MNKKEFKEFIGRGVPVYLDGATGSNLVKRGMPAGVCPEKWILENKEVMIGLQEEYLLAGSDIIYAPTFTSNSVKLKEYGLEKDIMRINHGLVGVSKEAVRRFHEKYPDRQVLICGDLTMTGIQLKPIGPMEFETLVSIYKEQIGYLCDAGVDLLVVETMMSLQECRAAVIAAKEVCDLPVMVTMSFEEDGRSLYGTDAVTALATLQYLGVEAFGVNCSCGPDKMLEIIQNLSEFARIPIICKPNAGLPSLSPDGSTFYNMKEDEFVEHMIDIVGAGACVLGGCCGTTPQYIEQLKEKTKNMPVSFCEHKPLRILTSERQYLSFDLDSRFLIVGERINPTGKKALQEELRNGCFDIVREFAEEQEARGASVLDVNMGMSGIDEKDVMLKAIEEVTQTVNLPLSIDTSHVDVMEQALRHYPGRALINSISLETEKFEKLLPIAKKYGAMFVLLPLSDAGLPKDIEEKKQIIRTILNRALELGMEKEDIVVDGLVATVGANKNAAVETLETIRFCRELGLATICGLSNISFGLPERSYINTVFLTMAIQTGLTMAIANPNQDLLVSSAFAADLLLNKENADIRYIERIDFEKEQKARAVSKEVPAADLKAQPSLSSAPRDTGTPALPPVLEAVYKGVLKGNKGKIRELAKDAVDAGMEASGVLNEALLPAINKVGDYFDQGRYFLPQLIASAEAMKNAIEYLEPFLMQESSSEHMPVIVIATVEGDIHDIGKNLVALMLKNYGFRVIDLGKDVPKETIVDAAEENSADIIALSALMTTTMKEMKNVVDLAKSRGIAAKIMIGGAVITQEYADEIGADGYSKDAADAVKVAKKLTGGING